MTTICWTVVHHSMAPVAHGVARIAHAAHRFAGPIVHRGAQVVHHVATGAASPQVWFELVCKVVPAAVAGGGLLIPHPANPPALSAPPAIVQPAPPPGIWAPPNWTMPPAGGLEPYAPPPNAEDISEPSSALVLGIGGAGLVALRFARRSARRPRSE